MAKKPSIQKPHSAKPGYLPLLAAPIFLAVLLGTVFLGEAAGLINMDSQSLRSDAL